MKFPHAVFTVLLMLSFIGVSSAAFCGGGSQCACGDTVIANHLMNSPLICGAGVGLTIGAPGVTLDCGGNPIQSTGGGTTGIVNSGQNSVVIQNCGIINYNAGILLSGATSGAIVGNQINVISDGILAQSATGNTITGNTINGLSNGIWLGSGSSGNNLNSNTISNSAYGIRIEAAGNTLNGNTITGSNTYGLYISSATNTIASNTHVYNNAGKDVFVGTGGTPIQVNLNNLIVDKPFGGNYTNSSNISVTDTVEVFTNYTIDYATSPSLPPLTNSFHQKFVEITGATSIDSVTWHWLPSEEAGFALQNLDIFEYSSGTWTKLGASLNLNARTLTKNALIPHSIYGPLEEVAPVDLYGANVSNVTDYRWYGASPGNDTVEGGNITDADISSQTLTDRWAAYFGNVSGNLVLTDNAASNYVYSWSWNPSYGGTVCLSTNGSLSRFVARGANGTEIDNAWGFDSSVIDSGNNTFTQNNCSVDMGSVNITNTSYVDNGQNGGFITCALKQNVTTPTKPEMLFCGNIIQNGLTYNNSYADFEVMVPTAYGPTATETYYFYLSLG